MVIQELYCPNRKTIEINTAIADLYRLSLVCTTLNRLAYQTLHSHIFLPSAEKIKHFIRTAQSDQWRRGPAGQHLANPDRAGFIVNWKSKGRGAKGDASVAESGLVGEAVEGMGRESLTRLELTSLPLGWAALAGLSKLVQLQLECVGLVIEDGPVRLSLPCLRGLFIRNLVCSASHRHRNDADPALLINATVMPALTHLILVSSDSDFTVRHSSQLGCSALLANLTTLRIAGDAGWWGHNSDAFWRRLRGLKLLFLQPWDWYVASALRGVPSELEELHLDADETEEPEERLEEVVLEWDEECKCLGKLKELYLPQRESWVDDALAAKPAGWLGHMEAVARERGVKVGFKEVEVEEEVEAGDAEGELASAD